MMGFSWIFASLVCVLMADWGHAVCDQTYMGSAEVQNCMMGFSTFFGKVMGSGGSGSDSSDGSQMITAICSDEGRSAMACMFPILETCPEMVGAGGMPMTTQADLDTACNQLNPTSPCAAAGACMGSAAQGMDMGMDPNFRPTNNMTALLPLLGMTCGPMKEQFNCITAEVEEKCPSIPVQLKQMIPMMNKNMPGGIAFPEFDVLKAFIRTGCTGVPDDIMTNKCARYGMESAALKECMAKVETDFKTPMETKSCGATDARLMCMKESIEKPCGKNYYDALVTKGDMFLTKDFFTCDRSTTAAPVGRPCAAAGACMQAAAQGIDMGMDENFIPTNNMTALLPLLGMTCGPMKEQFNCITAEVEERCPSIPAQLKQMIPMMNNGMPDSLAFPEFDVLMAFIRNGCTGVPEDIATNKCAKDGMESAALKECMAKVETDFKMPMEMKSCGATDARLMCMKESIEKPCGKNYYDALVTKGDTFLTKDLFTCDRSNSAAPVGRPSAAPFVRLSVAASLLAVVAALLL